MMVYDLQKMFGRGTHNHSERFMLGRVSRTDRIDIDAVDTRASAAPVRKEITWISYLGK